MFEFTSSVLEDIQNKMLLQRSMTKRHEAEQSMKNSKNEISKSSVSHPDQSSPDK
jgi:hypothetical protein